MPRIVRASKLDAFDLVGSLREADRQEIEANGLTPMDGLLQSLEQSGDHSWAILGPGDQVLALTGAADCTDAVGFPCGSPWLLGTEALITRHKRWFLRHSPEIIRLSEPHYTRFFNMVDARNSAHVQWLRWVGFKVMEPIPHGPHGLPFHPFHREA